MRMDIQSNITAFRAHISSVGMTYFLISLGLIPEKRLCICGNGRVFALMAKERYMYISVRFRSAGRKLPSMTGPSLPYFRGRHGGGRRLDKEVSDLGYCK